MLMLWTYLGYLGISVPITMWVARTLHKNGRAFLIDAFHGHQELADSVNHLLVVGFYLINLGWIVMTLHSRGDLTDARGAVELLSDKVGTVLFVLGLMHFFNLYLFSRFRRRAMERVPAAPPIAPTGFFKAPETAR